MSTVRYLKEYEPAGTEHSHDITCSLLLFSITVSHILHPLSSLIIANGPLQPDPARQLLEHGRHSVVPKSESLSNFVAAAK